MWEHGREGVSGKVGGCELGGGEESRERERRVGRV